MPEIEAGCRLIQQENGGVLCEGPRNEYALALACAEICERSRGKLGCLGKRKSLGGKVAVCLALKAQLAIVGRSCHEDRFHDGESKCRDKLLADNGDFPGDRTGAVGPQVAAVQEDRARPGLEEPAQDADEGAFAHAIRSHDSEKGTCPGREADIFQNQRPRAVAKGNMFDLNGIRHVGQYTFLL